MPTVVMTAGAPYSGKTSLFKRAAEHAGWSYLCVDDILEHEVPGDVWTRERAMAAWDIAKSRLPHMIGNTPLVIDVTNPSQGQRYELVKLCRSAGATKVICYHFDIPLDVLLERAERSSRKRKVPTENIEIMATMLWKDPPSVDDGFDQVYKIFPRPWGWGNPLKD